MNDTQNSQTLITIAAQLLSGMLANPHIYPMVSDEGATGEQEIILRHHAMEMAQALINDLQKREKS